MNLTLSLPIAFYWVMLNLKKGKYTKPYLGILTNLQTMKVKIPESEPRTIEILREHYEIEKELANRLRNSSKEERQYLYNTIYGELDKKMLENPNVFYKRDPESNLLRVNSRMSLLKRFLTSTTIFLEVGPGDNSLSFRVSKRVKKVFAIDVSQYSTGAQNFPKNFELIISDGCSIPVPENGINVAYSDQLMEHLHPDDALDQLRNIYRALTNGGKYICITPNSLFGPYDISRYFDKVATGFHMKEYTFTELYELFRKIGFLKISVYIGGRNIYLRLPSFLMILNEKLLNMLSFPLRRVLADTLLFKALFCSIIIIGTK